MIQIVINHCHDLSFFYLLNDENGDAGVLKLIQLEELLIVVQIDEYFLVLMQIHPRRREKQKNRMYHIKID
jgi:hypothetical protein